MSIEQDYAEMEAKNRAEAIRRETLRPVVGCGWNDETQQYEENAAEVREQLRGASWWFKQMNEPSYATREQ